MLGRRAKGKTKTARASKPIDTPVTLDEQRKKVLKKARVHIKPLSIARHKVLALTGAIVLVLVLGFISSTAYLIYAKHSTSTLVYKVARVVPFPAAKVNSSFVSYADYLFEVRYTKNLYGNPALAASGQQQVDFKSEAGKKILVNIENQALEQAKTKALVEQLAKQKGVSVSNEELDKTTQEIIQSQGGDQKFRDAIKQFYGWDLGDYRKELHAQMLKRKLELQYPPSISEDQRKKAESIRERAAKGQDFVKLAKRYSQDPGSKSKGGDVGFIADQPFVEEFKSAALKLKRGEISQVVETKFGFHIIKATATKDKDVRVSHILILYAKDLDAIIKEKLNDAKTSNFIKLPKPETSAQ